MEVKLLDHGYCRLIDHMGSDLSVSRAARVSHNADWRAGEDAGSDRKLIDFLWKNWHTTPFEAVTLTMEIQAPIFVFRQWHRHRTQSYNEVSARYTQLPELFYLPKPELVGKQSTFNKQARTTAADVEDTLLIMKRAHQVEQIAAHCEDGFALYRELLEDGWPRELARMVLGLNTYTRMFATMNLLNMLKFVTLRSNPHAQYEIMVYSDAMLALAHSFVPVVCEVFGRYELKMVERIELL